MARIYIVEYGAVFYGTKDEFEKEFVSYPLANVSDKVAADSARHMVEAMCYDFHAIDGELISRDDLDLMSCDEEKKAIMDQITEYEAIKNP